MYDPTMVQPMREELISIGFKELKTAAEVDDAMQNAKGTSFLFVNSVCGCAAGQARPGIALALTSDIKPDNLFTVFAGQDAEATAQARSYILGIPPSSPAMALFKDGELVTMIERHQIENNSAEQVAGRLMEAFKAHCSNN
ncbi:BrxA/BrxB family bacilliredoxin [candidate division KSB1 bacterium]|nr:BrxA/BrxB family bacilliredoxin [candidate division KSB1 bacterium]TDI93703.1 MAG: BrxA/BrxB family bacilliredoxin [Caldithrix sp.]